LCSKKSYLFSSKPALKKVAAILLLSVLLFNLCGYKLVLSLLETKAQQSLEANLDNNNYDEADLVEIRVPLNMPYQQRFTDYERHYGDIEIDGQSYTYVKRKIEGDVVIFKCIANTSKQELKEKENELAKSNAPVNDTNKKQSSSVKTFSGDYDDKSFFDYTIFLDAASLKDRTFYISSLSDGQLNTLYQPPEFS
jgi:hypothetical protein